MKIIKLLFVSFLILFSCQNEGNEENEEIVKSSENSIISFKIDGIKTKIEGDIITIFIPSSTKNLIFYPTIKLSDKATDNLSNKSSINFSEEKSVKVVAEDSTERIYTIDLVYESGVKNISFELYGDNGRSKKFAAKINEEEKEIIIDYIRDDLSWFSQKTIRIDLIGDITSNPKSESNINVDELKTIQIINNGVVTDYAIFFRNNSNDIEKISFPSIHDSDKGIHAWWFHDERFKHNENLDDDDIVYQVLEDKDVTNLVPKIEISYRATISPDLNIAQDFSQDITYTVTSESGSVDDVKVRLYKSKIIFHDFKDPSSRLGGQSSSFTAIYSSVSKVIKVSLVNHENKDEIPCEITENPYMNSKTETYVRFKFSKPLLKCYYLKVVLENGDEIDTTVGICG